MSFDDLEAGKCPYCGGDIVTDEDLSRYCDECGCAAFGG